MFEFILNFFLVVLVLMGLLCILVVLMQKTSTQPGMGAALTGGGAADQAFGVESTTILTKSTQILTVLFFVVSFLLYLGFQAKYTDARTRDADSILPDAPLAPAGAETEVRITPAPGGDTEPDR